MVNDCLQLLALARSTRVSMLQMHRGDNVGPLESALLLFIQIQNINSESLERMHCHDTHFALSRVASEQFTFAVCKLRKLYDQVYPQGAIVIYPQSAAHRLEKNLLSHTCRYDADMHSIIVSQSCKQLCACFAYTSVI